MSGQSAIASIRSFNRFYTNVIGAIDQHILNSPYSLTEVRVLWEIYSNAAGTARTISERLSIDEGYLSRSIGRLVRLGLVKKERSTDDGRIFRLSQTKAGRATFLELNGKADLGIQSMLDGLSDAEVALVVKNLRQARKILERRRS